MKRALAVTLALALVACGKRPANNDCSDCEHKLAATEDLLRRARADQAAADEKIAELELQARDAREELAGVRPPERREKRGKKRGESEVSAPGVRIGLSLPARRERWIKQKLTLLTEAKKRGIELLVQVTDDDAARQVSQCETLIGQGIKVLILAPVDGSAAAAIVEKAVKAGVKVLSYERLVLDSPYDYTYVSFDGVRVGTMQGDFLTRKVPRGTYVVVAGPQTDNNAKLFHQGAMSVLQPFVDRGDIKLAMDRFASSWQPADARKLCEQAISDTRGRIDAVLTATDGQAGACIEVLAEHGLSGKVPVTGQDAELAAAIRLLDGTQGMTVLKDTRELARKAMDVAAELARGKAVDTRGVRINNNVKSIPAVLLTPRLVTKDNLDDAVIRNGYLNREAVYRK